MIGRYSNRNLCCEAGRRRDERGHALVDREVALSRSVPQIPSPRFGR